MPDSWSILTFAVGFFFSFVGFIFLLRNGWDPRWLRKLLTRRRRECKSLLWKDIPSGQLASGEKCNACNLGLEHESSVSPVLEHESASECWSQTVAEVFSSAGFRETSFPRRLDDPHRYLCVDVNVLLAFIFSVIPDTDREISSNEAPGTVFDGSVVDLIEEEGNLIAHVNGTHRRYLTLEDCDGLVHSFPPWYRRTIKLNYPNENLILQHPCFQNPRNCARAGWVIAAALTDVAPVPTYLDRSTVVDGPGRGKVLRAGCIRARVVLERLRGLQVRAYNLVAAISEIQKLLDEGPSLGSYVQKPKDESVSAAEYLHLARVAIQIFDTKPSDKLSAEAMQALETKADLIVHWASLGVYKVLEYWKNPGREIQWDERLKPGRKIYLQDCRLSMR